MKFLKFGFSAGSILAAGCAMAVNFGSTAVVNGNTYTIGAAPGLGGIAIQQIGDSLSFALPGGVAINTTKTFTLTYSVSSMVGNLTSLTNILGTAAATGASSVTTQTAFSGGVGPNENSGLVSYAAGSTFPTSTYTFATATPQWTTVTTTLQLNGSQGFAKVSTYNANYVEVVPEPASMAALAVASLGLIARRRRKN